MSDGNLKMADNYEKSQAVIHSPEILDISAYTVV